MSGAELAIILLPILIGLVTGVYLARIAATKQRDALFWFLAGLGLGLPALLFQYLIPHRQRLRRPERVRRYERPALRHLNRFLVSSPILAQVYALAAVAADEPLRLTLPLIGLFLTAWTFAAAIALARLLLLLEWKPMAVARVVLHEATHSRIAVGFVVFMLIVLTLLTMIVSHDGDQPLRYRVQSFLSWSLITVGLFQGLLTIFFACWTLGAEIGDKRIHTVAVKPIDRATYVLGKWLGIVTLNAVLLAVVGAAIYSFTVFYLARLEPVDSYDGYALREEVLTARIVTQPRPTVPMAVQARQRIEQIRQEQSQRLLELGRQIAEQRGLTGLGTQGLIDLGSDQLEPQLIMEVARQWLSVGPEQSKTFVFEGLGSLKTQWDRTVERWRAEAEAARAAGLRAPPPPETRGVQLRYNIKTPGYVPPEGKVTMRLKVNGRAIEDEPGQETITLIAGNAQVIQIPLAFIDDEGRIHLEVTNPGYNPTIVFDTEGGLEVLYRAGGFGANFVRGIAALWVKLAFLAMLGVMAATFLGFPVACLLSLLVAVGAVGSPYLLESLSTFGQEENQTELAVVDAVIQKVAYGVAQALERYSAYQPSQLIARGRMFSWQQLLACAGWIGGLWMGIAAATAALVFRGRELARVQV